MRTTNLKQIVFVTMISLLHAVAAWAETYATHTELSVADAGEEYEMKAQTNCPVGGNPIDKEVFVTYQGQKIYFCCPGCDKDFEKDPSKYLLHIR